MRLSGGRKEGRNAESARSGRLYTMTPAIIKTTAYYLKPANVYNYTLCQVGGKKPLRLNSLEENPTQSSVGGDGATRAFLISTQAGGNVGVTGKKVERPMHSLNLHVIQRNMNWLAGIIESQNFLFESRLCRDESAAETLCIAPRGERQGDSVAAGVFLQISHNNWLKTALHHLPGASFLPLRARNKRLFIASKLSAGIRRLDGNRPSASVNIGIF